MSEQQHMVALGLGNARRLAGARLRSDLAKLPRDIAVLRVAEIIEQPDPTAGALTWDQLVACPHRWGKMQCHRVAELFEGRTGRHPGARRLRAMSDRDRRLLAYCVVDVDCDGLRRTVAGWKDAA